MKKGSISKQQTIRPNVPFQPARNDLNIRSNQRCSHFNNVDDSSTTIQLQIKQNDTTNNTYRYVALGDSIVNGRTVFGTKYSYANQLRDYLENKLNKKIIYNNFGTTGIESSELLDELTNNQEMIESIQEADLITLSIGGNDIMQAARQRVFYNFSDVNYDQAVEGRAHFEQYWTQIINQINEYRKEDSKLLVMTIYNPYNVEDELHEPLNDLLFNGRNGINDLIWNNSNLNYEVVDVYTVFREYALRNEMKQITHFYDQLFLVIEIKDPHPTSLGQKIIYKLHKSIYKYM